MATIGNGKDSYLEGRLLETQARQENSAAIWEGFAHIKASKGSYPLAALGYLNAGIAHEAAGSEAAADAYQHGLDIAKKGKLKESVLILGTRLAALHERARNFRQAVAVYEQMSVYFEDQGAWFLAADASEHAAEMMKMGGQDVSRYRRPADLWLRNAEYWADKDAGDEAWSRRRAELYLEGIQP
ncbi:MAG: hypothetical protein Q4G39_00920 [Brachymonas sp.]|nr:hypothetical protein [Brachymonas sp.]